MKHIDLKQKHWEPSRDNKQWNPKTRSRDHGLIFGTDGYASDTVALFVALLLSTYIYSQFAICAGLNVRYFVLSVFVQIVLGLVAHWGIGKEAVIAAELELVEPTSAHAEHLRNQIGWLRRWTRAFAIFFIWSFALLEIFLFSRLAPPATPLAVLCAVSLSSLIAAWIHSGATGFFVFESCRRLAGWWKRRQVFKSPNYEEHHCFIKRHRNHTFTSKVKLVAGKIPPHELIAITEDSGMFTHTLKTWGLLMNREVNSLLALQTSPEQRTILRRECVRVQLEILRSEPLGRVDSDDDANPPGSPANLLPPSPPLASMPLTVAARVSATAVIFAALSLNACVKKDSGTGSRSVTIDVVLAAPEHTATVPQELLEVLSPKDGFQGGIALAAAQVNIASAANLDEAISCQVGESDSPWERRLVGGKVAPHEFSRALRTKLAALKLPDNFAQPPDNIETLLGKIADRLLQAQPSLTNVPILNYNPSAFAETTSEVGQCTITTCKTAENATVTLQRLLGNGDSHVVVAYGIDFARLSPIAQAHETSTEPSSQSVEQAASEAKPDERNTTLVPVAGGTTVIVNPAAGDKPNLSLQLPENYGPLDSIYFDEDSAKLTRRAWKQMDKANAALKRAGQNKVIIASGADPKGKEKDNANLAQRRGQAVRAAFLSYGISVEVLAIGESLAPDDTPIEERWRFRVVNIFCEKM